MRDRTRRPQQLASVEEVTQVFQPSGRLLEVSERDQAGALTSKPHQAQLKSHKRRAFSSS